MKKFLIAILMMLFCADLYARPTQENVAEKTTPAVATGTAANEGQKTNEKTDKEKALNKWLNQGSPDFSDKMNTNTDNLPLSRF